MEPSGQRNLRLTLAGFQAGCLGTLLMLGWWVVGELLQHRSPWTVPNLLATTFYGENAYRSKFIVPTWSGFAGPLVVYCAGGVVFALAARERLKGWFVLLAGVIFAMALNWLFFGVVIARINPMVAIYSPDRLITVSHLLYGVALARYPRFERQLVPVAEPAPPEAPVAPEASAPAQPSINEAPAASDPHDSSDQEVGRSIP